MKTWLQDSGSVTVTHFRVVVWENGKVDSWKKIMQEQKIHIYITEERDTYLNLLSTFCVQTSFKLHWQLVHIIATYPWLVHTWNTTPPYKISWAQFQTLLQVTAGQWLRTSSENVLSICRCLYSSGRGGHWEILDELNTLTQLCSSRWPDQE